MPFLDKVDQAYEIERCRREAWTIFKGMHVHDCYELYYLVDGEITYFVEDKIYTVRQGDFILIPPGVIHKTLPYRRRDHTRILIYLKPGFIQDFLQQDPKLLDCFSTTLVSVGSKRTAEYLLFHLLEEEEAANPVMVRALLGELLVWLGRWAEKETQLSGTPQTGMMNGVGGKVPEVVRYLNTHYMEEISLEKLARRFYLNPSYLSRNFHKVMGVSYSDYLLHVRMRQAVQLLNHTDKKVSEISLAVGFHSDNHFCKMFRQVMGISPLRYRKEQRGRDA